MLLQKQDNTKLNSLNSTFKLDTYCREKREKYAIPNGNWPIKIKGPIERTPEKRFKQSCGFSSKMYLFFVEYDWFGRKPYEQNLTARE